MIPQETKDAIWEVFKTLDEFLQQSEYFAGENLTIADFSIVASVSSLNVSYNFNQTINNLY